MPEEEDFLINVNIIFTEDDGIKGMSEVLKIPGVYVNRFCSADFLENGEPAVGIEVRATVPYSVLDIF